jgi:hypothetical protein
VDDIRQEIDNGFNALSSLKPPFCLIRSECLRRAKPIGF